MPILSRLEIESGLSFVLVARNSNRGVSIRKAVTGDRWLVVGATWRKRKAGSEIAKNLRLGILSLLILLDLQ
jgi:hypothetical protein